MIFTTGFQGPLFPSGPQVSVEALQRLLVAVCQEVLTGQAQCDAHAVRQLFGLRTPRVLTRQGVATLATPQAAGPDDRPAYLHAHAPLALGAEPSSCSRMSSQALRGPSLAFAVYLPQL